MPNKRKKQNVVQGKVGQPIDELQRLALEGSGFLNKMGLPAGVEDIEVEFPRSFERAQSADLADGKDQPLKPRKID